MASNNPAPLPFSIVPPALTDLIAGRNHELMAAVKHLSEGQSAVNSIYVWGEANSGKSALLRAACTHARRRQHTAYFVSAEDDSLPPLGGGLLAADDIHLLDAETQNRLEDWKRRADSQTSRHFLLVSADCAPSSLPLQQSLASRLAAGLIFRLYPLSDADKNQALSAWAQRRGFTLPAEVADLLLTHLPRGMHELTAALANLDTYFLAQQKPLTRRRVNAWLAKQVS